ncbi:MAG: hypothetical protein K6T65_06080 [Peptococcaceae bacterium]|nr:hypothetical protein [Peptococcaceae bacterium]
MNIHKKYTLFLLIFGIIFSIVFTYSNQLNHIDNDTFWHIKTGEFIFLNRQVPTVDIFSWYGMENNLRWINHEWFFDLLVYSIYRAGGMQAVVAGASLLAGFLFFLIYRYTLIRCGNNVLSLVIAFMGICGLSAYVCPRPQVLSYCILIILAVILEKKKWFWAIPVVVMGTNLHGGFYPMYILLTIYYAWKEKPLLIPLSLLAVLINPYGWEMLTYPLLVQKNIDFNKYISEWNPTQLGHLGSIYYLFCYIILLISVFNKRLRIGDAALSLLLVIQSLMASRHVVFIFILVLPILSPYIAERFSRVKLKTDNRLFKNAIHITCIFLYFFLSYMCLAGFKEKGLQIKYDDYPEKAVAFIKENNIERIGNMYNEGGFLIFNGINTFIDGRADIFSPVYNKTNLFVDYCRFYHLEIDYMDFINRHKLNNLLISKKTSIYIVLKNNKHFKPIYQDDRFVIFNYDRG